MGNLSTSNIGGGMRTPSDFRVLANIGSLIESFFASSKRKTDSSYSVEITVKERNVPVGRIKADSTMTKIFDIGGV